MPLTGGCAARRFVPWSRDERTIAHAAVPARIPTLSWSSIACPSIVRVDNTDVGRVTRAQRASLQREAAAASTDKADPSGRRTTRCDTMDDHVTHARSDECDILTTESRWGKHRERQTHTARIRPRGRAMAQIRSSPIHRSAPPLPCSHGHRTASSTISNKQAIELQGHCWRYGVRRHSKRWSAVTCAPPPGRHSEFPSVS